MYRCLADLRGAASDLYNTSFYVYVDGRQILSASYSDRDGGDHYVKYKVTAYSTYGNVRVYSGGSGGSDIVNPSGSTVTLKSTSDSYYMYVEFYPNDAYFATALQDKSSIQVKMESYESGNSSVTTGSFTLSNPISDVALQDVQYSSYPDYHGTIVRSGYNSTYDAGKSCYLEYYNLNEVTLNSSTILKKESRSLENYNSNSFVTPGSLTEAEVTEGRKLRVCYYSSPTGNQKLTYTKYSNTVQVQPVKLPDNPRVEDAGCGKLKIKWDVGTGTQSSQAGNVKIYRDGTQIGETAYSNGSSGYEWTIPASDIGTGSKTYTFMLARVPFSNTSKNIVKTVSFTKNMNYRQPRNIDISPGGGTGFSLSWTTDNGYYCSNYKYRIKVTQGSETYISPLSDITTTSADITVSGGSFNLCDPVSIYFEMIDTENSNKVLVSQKVSDSYVFVTNSGKSTFTTFAASKGFYTGYVKLDWAVSADNEFVKYILYRKEYGNTDASNGMQLAVIDHSGGIASYTYEDVSAVPGIYYTYTVAGQLTCGSNILSTIATANSVGFIQPYGTVSGRVSFEGGSQAVLGVGVIAEGSGESKNKALDFNAAAQTYIKTPYGGDMLSNTAFTFQAWVFVRKEAVTTTIQSLMDAAGKYGVEIDGSTIWLSVYKGNDTEYTEYEFDGASFMQNTYQHISISYRTEGNTGTAILYINGLPADTTVNTGITVHNFPTASAADKCIYFGRYWENNNYLNGYMDELRLWKRTLPAEEIAQNYDRYLSGKETGLALYYRFDELDNFGEVYDLSAAGSKFNENHGVVHGSVQRTNEPGTVPTANQLAIKALTDADGNYLLNTIPYSGEGNTYNIIPMLGVHKFNPSQKPLYFSANSTTHNNIDFTDVSSFEVGGTVIYEGGTYPVEGCTFEVDGMQLVAGGQPVTSDAQGRFIISVPIGEHKVQVKKNGHTFLNDGYLTNPETGGMRNYNDRLTGIVFHDQTRVKLIGHIVGGKREHEKTSGFGLRVNNIGADVLTLTAAKEAYKLSESQRDTTFPHNTGDRYANWTNPENISQDSTQMRVRNNTVTIHVSPETGEYVAWLYPELYLVENISAGNLGTVYDRREALDLRETPVINEQLLTTSVYTWNDSVWIAPKGNMAAHWEQREHNDTVRYHSEWSFYHQAEPSYTVEQIVKNAPVKYFGELEYKIKDDTLMLVNTPETTPDYAFGKPVFIQGEPYAFRLSAFEEYVNPTKNRTDIVPVSGGVVSFAGELLMETNPESIELDSLGQGVFEFLGGMANLTTGVNALSTMVGIDGYPYYSQTFGASGMEAYVLGGRSTGTDFLTAANDKVSFVLHDPPGTAGYAYIEEGTTTSTTTTVELSEGLSFETTLMGVLGVKNVTLVGVGAMTGGETETTSKIGAQVEIEAAYNRNYNFTETYTYTERFETSSNAQFVGHEADVYVGMGTNTLYGLTNNIAIAPTTDFGDPADILLNGGNYSIGLQSALALGVTFGTQFMYTGNDIENIMIPKWEDVLKSQFVFSESDVNTAEIVNPVYVSKLPADHPNFGKRNDDPAFGAEATTSLDGPSYKLIIPDALKSKFADGLNPNYTGAAIGTVEFTDSVIYYNDKIKQWKEILADNERRKVQASYSEGKNISFGGGITYERSETRDTIESWEHGASLSHNIYAVTENVLDVFGTGMVFNASVGEQGEYYASSTSEDVNTSTVGFVLQEEGNTDQITVDYGFDYESMPHTYIFKTRGGRTSCPYEAEVRTEYYEPGQHVITEGTMQIENPKIAVEGGVYRVQVPANRPATFTLNLTNESETGATGWFLLAVDESTNPNGAILKIDGGTIGNGRYFEVPSGSVLKKTLTIEKGVVDTYENISIVLKSDCQCDPTDFLPDISDNVMVSVDFLPACSEVDIQSPVDNWIINTATGDSIEIMLKNYDINFANFGYVELQYRSASATQWNTEMKFYANEARYNAATGAKTLLGTEPDIKYMWHKDQKADGIYELRAHTVCETESGVQVAEYYTPAVTGTIDMSRPESMGNPSPVNGIYGAGDEISITFNEDIRTGMLTHNNFRITGVLNASNIAEPNTGLAFSGAGSAFTELPVYANGSFSIETWFKRTKNTAGTLFAYGAGNETISLGFDASGKAIVTIGDETKTSTAAINNTDDTWKYIGLTYDRDAASVSVYAFQSGDPTIVLFDNVSFTQTPAAQGKLYVGNNTAGNNGLQGATGLLHFYDTAHTPTEMSAVMNVTKSGSEPNLIGLWEMNEGEGNVAKDKARARNLTLQTGWYIYPAGKSIAFNGTTQYATIPSGTFPFRYYDDFTVEMQFRGGNANANATLLSIGTTAYIGFNDGNLTLTVGENTQKLAPAASLLDNGWHHIALSVKRNGMATAVIDGVTKATFNSSIFSGTVGGGNYWLGVKYTYDNDGASYAGYFAGNIDEVRVWNTALNTETIRRNRNFKLHGTETGLQAYYPFETWTKNFDGTYNVLASDEDRVDSSNRIGGTGVINAEAASLIDARPETEVPFTFTASSNKVIINITEPLYRIEGVTLNLSASGIFDLRNNESKPANWIAYVNRSPLNWSADKVEIIMEEGANQTFKVSIANAGGVAADYYIDNLPEWLTVNAPSGTLQPLTNKELTFTISQGVNIGSYEAAVALTGMNDVKKVLPVHLKVTGQRPDWAVNANEYEFSMNVTGQVQIQGVYQEDEDDIIGAFIGDLCVGAGSPEYIASLNAYYLFLDVYGNGEHKNRPLTFKLWDAGTGRIYPQVETPDIKFVANAITGLITDPVLLNATDIMEQSVKMKTGWNWISVNVLNNNPSILDQMKTSLNDVANNIKGVSKFLLKPSTTWTGNLTSISATDMYQVNLTQAYTMILKGTPVNPSATPVSLAANNWNWIGYTPAATMPVKTALAGIDASVGDQIKAQSKFAQYTGATSGWIGSLKDMQPGMGYMYKSTATTAKTFCYPNTTALRSTELRSAETTVKPKWTADVSHFPDNMTVTALVLDGETEVYSDRIEIAAFSGDECRGSALLQYVEGLDKPYQGFLMIYGEEGDKLNFKVYDHVEQVEYTVACRVNTFTVNGIYGNPLYPESFTIRSLTGINRIGAALQIYPNPVKEILYLERGRAKIDMLEIVDISGVTLLGEVDFEAPSLRVSHLAAGVYLLKVTFDGETSVYKFRKQ
ncbi:MAG: T9SS type A sorting domain-containing protein [Dysgonamonadaceae bacterium]|jgi:hypothetical protein|nr:T9SS type A sorting domain-containing protein [Dysgonamonadaceae bacterium]